MVKICTVTYPLTSVYECYFNTFPYHLSAFQKHAIQAIVDGNHVLVTAHTGSGKTLPAEFAIRHFTNKKKKLIYTSPIKALSNQKYYDFCKKFPDVSIGLFTGDIKTNPEADILIMTTEILMNTLFNHVHNSDKTTSTQMTFQIDFDTELAAVVFDEVHYINDEHRGQVWEKTIMMLPEHVQKIMLSATIDNPTRFAQWCETIHPTSTRCVCLTTTEIRVVPLTHYGFVAFNDSNVKEIKNKEVQEFIRKNRNKLIQIQNDKGLFDPTNKGYANLLSLQKHIQDNRFIIKRKSVLNQLLSFLKQRDMLPAIAFVFSRKNVEVFAKELTVSLIDEDSKQSYTIQRECDSIIRRLSNCSEYLEMPEYIELVKLLEKGIAIHHSGMIPILKEIVEICISKKYVKLLFATESFAIGLDCPIKTVVFTSLTKFDGNTQRLLEPHEYTQMAGRAGRRGIDTVGNIIHCNNLFKLPDKGTYLTILKGKPPNLASKFKIAYDLVLNIIKTSAKDDHCEKRNDSISVMKKFVEGTMLNVEINSKINHYKDYAKDQKINMSWTRITPYDICQSYLNLKTDELKYGNKKKKEAQKKMKELEDKYPSISNDIAYSKDYYRINCEYNQSIDHIQYLESSVSDNINKICSNLKHLELISFQEYGKMELTHIGLFASYISEINPILWSKCIVEKWNYFEEFTPRQIIGILSCTADIKVPPDLKITTPNSNDDFLKNKIHEIALTEQEYTDIENKMGIDTSTSEEHQLLYDIIDESMKWCDCQTEHDCKTFIQTDLANKCISIGDFSKAMLKIATISRELINIGTLETFKCQVEFLNKLSHIEGLVLKYIVTNQSLYV